MDTFYTRVPRNYCSIEFPDALYSPGLPISWVSLSFGFRCIQFWILLASGQKEEEEAGSYQAPACQERMSSKGSVSWVLPLTSVLFLNENEELNYLIKLFKLFSSGIVITGARQGEHEP